MHSQLFTAQQVAEILNVSLPRLYELARTGMIPVVRVGRQLRFSREMLDAWIAAGGRPLPAGWRRMEETDRV